MLDEDNITCNIPTSKSHSPVHQLHLIKPEINSVFDPITGCMLKYRHLLKGPNKYIWKRALANDLGRLAQGVGTRMKKGTNTIFFIHLKQMPKGKKIAHCKLVASIRPLKEEINNVRVTIGGDSTEYERNKSTLLVTLTTVKVYLNSATSTKKARHMNADIKDFYCITPMQEYQYSHLPLDLIPDEIVKQ